MILKDDLYVKLIGASLPHFSSGFEKQTINFTFSIKLGLDDRRFSCKVVSMVRVDQSARDIITYFNENSIDLTTDLPKNDG